MSPKVRSGSTVDGTVRAVSGFLHGARQHRIALMPRQVFFALALLGAATSANAQTPLPTQAPASKDCPPGTSANAPTINGNSKQNLSEKLASSKGIICPPAGVDPEMRQKPPEGGAIKVVPPPGSPGGDQNVQPK
jgi:hypothetical protein